MWNGLKKEITFSFDDGIEQDKRLIALFDKYGLKCTFNINSGFFGMKSSLIRNEREVRHDKIDAEEIHDIYQNHEVAVHGLTHQNFRFIPTDEKLIEQIEEDRKSLKKLTGKEIVGAGYPHGGTNEHV